MSDYSKLFRRSQALILAIAIMLTAIGPVWWTGVSADDKIPEKRSAGEIVANNYDLTDAEKAVIESGYLIGESYEFVAPDDDDNLISVDIDNKIIEAKDFTDSEGNKWVPTGAYIVVSEDVKEEVSLTNGKGAYTYDGNAFSVKVDYTFYLDIDEDTQEILLKAPNAFKEAVLNLEAISSNDTNLSSLLVAFKDGYMKQLIDGIEPNGIPVAFGDAAKGAASALQQQYDANGKFDINLLVEEYKAADQAGTKVLWLENNADRVEAVISDTYDKIATILADTVFDQGSLNLISYLDKALHTAMSALISQTNTWLSNSEDVKNSAWTINDHDYLNVSSSLLGLDLMVTSLGEITAMPAIRNPLVVNTVQVQYNMSMSNVTVNVVLKTVNDANKIAEYDTNTKKITLADKTTEAEIRAAVEESGIVNDSISEWSGVYFEAHFERSKSALPSELNDDITYTITYTPKNYSVNYKYNDLTVLLPYGYRIDLEPHAEVLKAYDYYVNDVYYAQGVSFNVEGDTTIRREEGKSYVQSNLKEVVNDCYFGDKSKPGMILGSSAVVIGKEEINVRYPDPLTDAGLVSVTGKDLTAQAYPSSYNGLTWMPYTYSVVGQVNGTYNFAEGVTTAVLPEGDYDRIEVTYRLVLSNINKEDVLEIINLPHILATDAKAQKDALDSLAAYNDTMSQLNKNMLGALSGMINSSDDLSTEMKEYFSGVVGEIYDKCLEGKQLKIANIISMYVDQNNGGLGYYYKNSEMIKDEIDLLSDYLSDMLSNDEKIEALQILLNAAGYGSYADKIEKLEKTMADVKAALIARDRHINPSDADLGNLVATLLGSGDTEEFYVVSDPALWLDSEKFVINANNKVTISVSVQTVGGKPVHIDPITFGKNYTLEDEDVTKIIDAINNAIEELGINDKYYTNNYSEDYFKSLAGKKASELDSSYKYTWTPITYTVNVEGADSQKITINNLTISLPASSDAAERYEYIIGGTNYQSGSYSFTLDEIDSLFDSYNTYNVKRVVIDIQKESIKNMVNTLNDAVGSNAIRFALVENNGKYSIVLKINAANTNELMSAAMNTAMGLVNSGYSYIGVDGNGLLYMDESNTLCIALQAIVDAVMNSGFGTDTLINVMDKNGNIKNMTLAGEVISNAVVGALGGKLVGTTMQLGNTVQDSYNVDFYITLGNAPEALTKVRNLIADQLSNYIRIVCEDGQAKVMLTLPQKAYEAYLAVLLATKNIDITDIDAINAEIAIGFVKDIIDPLFTGDVTTQTIENTLNKLGFELELSKYESIFQAFCDTYDKFTFTYDDKSMSAVGNVGMAAIIDKLNLGELGKMLVEYENGLDLAFNFSLENLGNQYNGLYFDLNAEGIVNKIGLTKDIASKLQTMAGTAVVVLLADVDDALVFNTSTVLNLNGQIVSNDIVANGRVIIVDTSLATDDCGVVEGDVSGNVIVVSGTYFDDVTDYIKEGYSQDKNGTVVNDIYSIVKDSEGNITVEIDAGVLSANSLPDIKAIAVDIIAELIFNGYTVNKLYVDGNKVYEITMDDFVGLYAGDDRLATVINKIVEMVDSKELTKLVNTILSDITDFAAIEEAIRNNRPIMSYDVLTGAWNVTLEHVEDGDYITGSLTSSNEKTGLLNILIVGTEADKDAVADIFGALADTTDIDVSVDLDHGFDSENDKNLVFDWSAQGSVIIDLTTDPNYAVMIGVMIADGLDASERADLVAAIVKFYETQSTTALKKAFNNLTTAQAIKALKNLQRGDSFVDMVANLGLEDYVDSDVAELEAIFDTLAKVAAAVLRRLPIEGGNRLLGSFMDPDGTYGFTRSDLGKSFFRELIKGYSVEINVEVSDIYVSIDIFGDVYPEFVDGTGTPEIADHDKIVGSYIDTDNKLIFIDAHYMGIKAEELLNLFTFYAKYADSITLELVGTDANSIVRNGAKLVATASTEAGLNATITYTIIIVGDVNGNGRIESGDAVLVSQCLVGLATLSEVQTYASDINCTGRTDIGDASIIAKKLIYWDEYVSIFED